MPVLALISAALIGDQEKLVLRMTSSLAQTCSPRTTDSASIAGITENASRTRIGGYGRTGWRACTGGVALVLDRFAAPARTRSMNAATSRLRGWKAIDEVVVADLASRSQLGARPVPRVLVVQHHRPPGAAPRAPGPPRGRRGSRRCGTPGSPGRASGSTHVSASGWASSSATVGLIARQLAGVVALVAEHVEQQPEDPVLGLGVPRRGQLPVGLLDGGDLPLAVLPRGEDRQEDVVALAGHVAPARRVACRTSSCE